MAIEMNATKLVVGDVEAAERFYSALGLKIVRRNTGGEGQYRQQQCWLSSTGDMSAHLLILSQFLELPRPGQTAYPGELWLTFNVADVDEITRVVIAEGGSVIREGQNRTEHGVRAAVVADPEGLVIEVVGPIV